MSQVHKKGRVSPEMNMTPMIDVVFQLIIFFMLVNQIIAEEAVEMLVPELDDPKTREMGEENRLTVNVVPHPYGSERKLGELNIPGDATMVKVGLDEFPLEDLKAVTDALKDAKTQNPELEILLRADAGLFYDEVQPIMQAISSAGIETVNLVAYLPEDQR